MNSFIKLFAAVSVLAALLVITCPSDQTMRAKLGEEMTGNALLGAVVVNSYTTTIADHFLWKEIYDVAGTRHGVGVLTMVIIYQ